MSWLPRIFLVVVVLAAPSSLAATYDNVSTAGAFETVLATAQGNGEDDVINLAAVTFDLPSTLTFVSAEDHSLTINGASRAGTVLDGRLSTQIMSLTSDAVPRTTTLTSRPCTSPCVGGAVT